MRRYSLTPMASVAFLAGCQILVGIEDTTLSPDASPDAVATDATSGGTPDSSGTFPDAPLGSFALGAVPTSAFVPYDGTALLEVSVVRSGFAEAIDVTATSTAAGFIATTATIAGAESTTSLELKASGTLAIGTSFVFTVRATAGAREAHQDIQGTVTGAPGGLDTSFASTGIVLMTLGADSGMLRDLRLGNDGSILAAGTAGGLAGRSAVVRYLEDGSPNPAFAGDGIITDLGFCGCSEWPTVVAVRWRAGQAITLGIDREAGVGNDIAVAGLTAAGAADEMFATIGYPTGRTYYDLGGALLSEHAETGIEGPSDSLYLAGERDGDFLLVRIAGDGELDATFAASAGWTSVGLSPGVDRAFGIATDRSDGTGAVTIVGMAAEGADADMGIARFLADGTLDASFSADGLLTLGEPGVPERAVGVVVLADGSLLIAGDRVTEQTELLLAHVGADGTPDAAFGDGGIRVIPLAAADTVADLLLLPDGRFLVATQRGSLLRFLPGPAPTLDPTLDPTFGQGGVAVPYVNDTARFSAMAFDASDNKLVVVGSGPPANADQCSRGMILRVWN